MPKRGERKQRKSYVGERNGFVVCIADLGLGSSGYRMLIKCDCGVEKEILVSNFKRTKSCGCRRREMIGAATATHGLTRPSMGRRPPEYEIWGNMIQRCTNPKRIGYSDYGGRGIKVCDRWRNDFVAFLLDMGPRPSPEHEIDRYPDNDGNYEPGNVRWATRAEQARNTRRNVFVEVSGERKVMADASDEVGVNRGTAYGRVRRGWEPANAIEQPVASRSTLNLQPGDKYSHLTVIRCLGRRPGSAHHVYLLQCECGATCERKGSLVTNGKPQWCYINCPVRVAQRRAERAEKPPLLCSTGCGRPVWARGLCGTCYQRLRHRGELPPLRRGAA